MILQILGHIALSSSYGERIGLLNRGLLVWVRGRVQCRDGCVKCRGQIKEPCCIYWNKRHLVIIYRGKIWILGHDLLRNTGSKHGPVLSKSYPLVNDRQCEVTAAAAAVLILQTPQSLLLPWKTKWGFLPQWNLQLSHIWLVCTFSSPRWQPTITRHSSDC